ncbi:peptidoglycan-binding domain-containing protein [Luteipulveratus flavus]|uniref:Peptidoglycan-binding domain-containing protein n=1 Tax=Luteipulveratus flavus TaxID=3031728 RepID=A0ABT6C5G2_9MICO|nr:peptidoglycan-binding domain-containing protein [Luteipulveratus sp. YIM 133296]MDF8264181.1 peptidoglycan-binding domain-containing protein [Luteipulveratus sp. YIM 133296]
MKTMTRLSGIGAAAVMMTGVGAALAPHASASVAQTPVAQVQMVPPGEYCTSYTSSRPELNPGATGAAVRKMQCLINNWRGYCALTIDGSYGPGTKEQVLAFQRKYTPTDVDASVGSRTWDALYRFNTPVKLSC